MAALFDKQVFVKTVPVLALKVVASAAATLREKLGKGALVSIPRIKSIIADSEDSSKRLLLLSETFSNAEAFPGETHSLIEEFKAEVVPHTVKLDYDYWTAHEVLTRLLPEGMDIPSSFETVGHIAHVNLRDEHAPFKTIIGHVLLEKNKHIRTVVNKVGSIDSTFRFFNMEVIAGDDDTMVTVSEEGCSFTFDYAKVYWNSRLHFEHRRLVQSMSRDELVCDMFCGVGPFALPAAKRGCVVYANDLNPDSIRWLRHNIARNKVDKRVHVYNMDAREFVAKAMADLRAAGSASAACFDHFIMNLPASAHEFLDIFPKLAQQRLFAPTELPRMTIHCYVFCKTGEDPLAKVDAGLGYAIDRTTSRSKRVRDVAPNKEMYCVSFKLPGSIFEGVPADPKRAKLE